MAHSLGWQVHFLLDENFTDGPCGWTLHSYAYNRLHVSILPLNKRSEKLAACFSCQRSWPHFSDNLDPLSVSYKPFPADFGLYSALKPIISAPFAFYQLDVAPVAHCRVESRFIGKENQKKMLPRQILCVIYTGSKHK